MPPEQEGRTLLPEWADDASLLRTVRTNFGVGADADLPDDLRFRVNVARLVRERIRHRTANEAAPPAVFFLLAGGPPEREHLELKREPMLDSGRAEIEGRLWFVGPAVIVGHGLPYDDWTDDDTIFVHAVDELQVGDVPAVIWEPRIDPPSVRFYPSGLAAPENYEHLHLGGQDVSIDAVLAVVDRIYGQCLITPTAQLVAGKLWKNRSKYIPVKDAEARIQLQLRNGLVTAYPTCVVRAEQTQSTGRLDLEIEEPSDREPHGFIRHALLELKVLRAKTSGGTGVSAQAIKDAVSEGVTQAWQYRDERGTKASALCCFDMRKAVTGEKCFEHERNRARRRRVKLRVWHIFASSSALRSHNETAAGPSAARPRKP
jgi:hypothetical protein